MGLSCVKHRGRGGRSIGAGDNALMGGDTRGFRGGGGMTTFHRATGPAPRPDLAAVLTPRPPSPSVPSRHAHSLNADLPGKSLLSRWNQSNGAAGCWDTFLPLHMDPVPQSSLGSVPLSCSRNRAPGPGQDHADT